MVTLHEVITFLVSMQISISSLQTHNVNRCGRSRHLARKLSLRRKRSSPNVFEMAATETITSIILIKLIRVSLGTVRHPRRFKIVVIDIQITLKQMLRDFIGIRVNRAKKSGMVNITSSVNSRERSGINTILHELIMSNIQTGAERMPHDLSHLGFLAGQIGRLITISTTPVIAGDSFEMDAVGALRLSPLRRGLAIDSTVDIFTFYVPHRHVYGEQWIKFMKAGVNATPLPTVKTTGYIDHAAFLGTINHDTNKFPKHLFQGYLNIYNNYFKAPWMPDRTEANPNELNQDDARYGFRCCHLKNIWTAPLPPETDLSRPMTTSTTSIDIMGLQAAYANLHTDQERDYFMQRYHDVISSFGGKTSYDADNRPLLVMRSNLWASGYDVDGTDQTSLGQFSGRVQQTYKHSVPRFFVPEHGTMFTLALVRFPPTATKEIQYLNAKGALTYTDIAGDPVLYGNLPPREISMKDVFRSGDSSKKFKIAEGQWYRYAPSYVSPAYHLLEGFPFIQEPP